MSRMQSSVVSAMWVRETELRGGVPAMSWEGKERRVCGPQVYPQGLAGHWCLSVSARIELGRRNGT